MGQVIEFVRKVGASEPDDVSQALSDIAKINKDDPVTSLMAIGVCESGDLVLSTVFHEDVSAHVILGLVETLKSRVLMDRLYREENYDF